MLDDAFDRAVGEKIVDRRLQRQRKIVTLRLDRQSDDPLALLQHGVGRQVDRVAGIPLDAAFEFSLLGDRQADRAGIDFYDLIEERSEFALPELVKTREGSYDLVFVDGWHTLDHTLLDCFYATRLLRTGGYLVVDDLVLPAVRRALEYVLQYPCYRVHKALGEETRSTLKRRVLQFLLGTLRLPAFSADALLHPDLRHRILGNRALRMLALRKTAPDGRDWNWYEPRF